MSTKPFPLSRWLLRAGAGIAFLAQASCAQPPPTASVAIPPIPRGEARVWFYRDLNPYETLARPYIRMNGGMVGLSEPGGAFYRDVPPGHYHVVAESYLDDACQNGDVDLLAGQQAYFKILPLEHWIPGRGSTGDYARHVFCSWIMPPEVAQAAVARSQFHAGGT